MLVALACFLLALVPAVEIFELRTLDIRFQVRHALREHLPEKPPDLKSDVVLVYIGDDSIAEFGRWPWSWERHADIVSILKQHGAKEIVFDVIFAEAPEDGSASSFAAVSRAAGNVFLCSAFRILQPGAREGQLLQGAGRIVPVAELSAAAAGIGHCNAMPDADGITRRIPLMIDAADGPVPSTALLSVLHHLGLDPKSVTVDPGRALVIPVPGRRPIRVPIDRTGQTMVNFNGDIDSFEAYSYLQVVQSALYPERAPVDLERFRGKTVLVGVTFAGNTDIRPTSLSRGYPLLCVLGTAMDNVIQDDFVVRWPVAVRLALVLLLGALAGWLTYLLRPVYSIVATLLLMGGWALGAFAIFRFGAVDVDLIAPESALVSVYLVMTTIQYMRNRREKMRYIEYLKYMEDLVESSNDAIIGFDSSGTIVIWNRGAAKIFGLGEAEAEGGSWEALVDEADRERVRAALEDARATGESHSLEVGGRRRGESFPVAMGISPVKDSRRTIVGLSCICQDLTERKKMIELLIQSEKMAEIGRLGSGIVHEIKNPLTSIMMLTGMVLGMENLTEKPRKYIAIIDQEAQRILRLCQNILSYARPKKPEMKPVDLNKIVEETLSLVEYELKKNKVTLRLDLAPGEAVAMGDDEKLKQVFLNLIINAVHAMEGGGDLEIVTRMHETAPPAPPEGFTVHTIGELEGERTVIQFRDHGTGIPSELLDKVFEAFFSTKAEGKGTGLGLYITRNIVLEHKGRLDVFTRPGKGTQFHIAIPAQPGEAPHVEPEQHA
jgi:PAS domain S-box-containing protein